MNLQSNRFTTFICLFSDEAYDKIIDILFSYNKSVTY